MNTNHSPQKKAAACCATFSQLGEFRVLTLREVPKFGVLNKPASVAEYYQKNIATDPRFNAEVETLVCLALTTRYEILGHYIVATGTLNTLLCHPREVFRAAIVANAAAITVLHNHPSGDPTPSEGDIKATRDVIRASRILMIEVLDHIIVGRPTPAHPCGFCSLREMGYFYDAIFNPSAPEAPSPEPQKIKNKTMKPNLQRCRNSSDAVTFWRAKVEALARFNPAAESFSAITLDSERRFVGVHPVASKSPGDAQRFADELLQSDFLRDVPEFVLVHHRPRLALKASAADIERVRAILLAGRSKKTELLDCIIVGKLDDDHPSGCFCFYKLKGFRAKNPFSKPSK
jgi:DNA repair protein RadC